MSVVPLKFPTREQILATQVSRLGHLVDEIATRNPFWQRRFHAAGLTASDLGTLEGLRRLPLLTKADLVNDQTAAPPYGTNLTYPMTEFCRLHQTSGTTGRPLRCLDTRESWTWFANCWRQIFSLAGLRADDRIFFPFSFGPFIGFWAAFEGAGRLGNLLIPAGGMSSEARLAMLRDLDATVVCCTPTYALRLAEVAVANNFPLAETAVRLIVVAGEPGGNVPAVRQRIEQIWGATVIDHWGMTELGSLASAAVGDRDGLYVLEEECIAELLDPATQQPVPTGELGELVVTNLGRVGCPLLRYRTGDLVRASVLPSPIGLNLLRLDGGILGRSDDMITIRGNNVFPSSVEAVVREFPEVAEFRIVVTLERSMRQLRLELEPLEHASAGDLTRRVNRAVKDRLNFQAEIVCVPVGSLPRYEMKARRLVREDLPQ